LVGVVDAWQIQSIFGGGVDFLLAEIVARTRDSAFFIASKLIWPIIEPETWIVFGLALTWFALSRGRHRSARITVMLTFAFTVVMAVFPLGELLLRPLEGRFTPNPQLFLVEGIIVLGGAEDARKSALWGQPLLNEAGERYMAALALARRFPHARVLFTGGSGDLRDIGKADQSEAKIAEQLFEEQGLDPKRLILERASRNTAENAKLSFELVSPSPYENWVLVTSAFHMPRALRSFKLAGWRHIIPFPVDFRSGRFTDDIGWDLGRNLELLNVAVKEYVGLLVYRLTGR
jgi:uncharacterized SAM-binding protein YcdF (DUF218 family)